MLLYCLMVALLWVFCFFFQAEDGIRDAQESRGLGDVYKRQPLFYANALHSTPVALQLRVQHGQAQPKPIDPREGLSLIHI